MKFFSKALLCLAVLAAPLAQAGDVTPFDQTSFDKLTAAGRPVVIAVHAPWCPTCKAQQPIQSGLMAKPDFKDVTLMTVDFDSQKPVLKEFKVNAQSTMIVMKGKKEVARSVGDTSAAGIEGAIRKAL